MTKIPESLIEKVPEMDIATLWEHFKVLEPTKKLLDKVKNGINAMFDVRVITNGYYEEFPKTKLVRLDGYGEMNLYAFLDELEERKEIMLKFIYDNYNTDVTEGRVEEY